MNCVNKVSYYNSLSCRLKRLVSQRDVTSDPEAIRQVARATNNLLENLGSLAVEVRNTPGYPTPLKCL